MKILIFLCAAFLVLPSCFGKMNWEKWGVKCEPKIIRVPIEVDNCRSKEGRFLLKLKKSGLANN